MKRRYPTNPAARLSRSLIASPRPVAGMGETAIPVGRWRRNRLAAASAGDHTVLLLKVRSSAPSEMKLRRLALTKSHRLATKQGKEVGLTRDRSGT